MAKMAVGRALLNCLILFSSLFLQNIFAQTYSVLQYGAIGDGKTNDTSAIRATLSAAANSNGGRVIFDENHTFLTGCFNVTSNVILDIRGKILVPQDSSVFVPVQPVPW